MALRVVAGVVGTLALGALLAAVLVPAAVAVTVVMLALLVVVQVVPVEQAMALVAPGVALAALELLGAVTGLAVPALALARNRSVKTGGRR
jgi:hypothetical protein